MNLRQFLGTLGASVVVPWKSLINHKPEPKPLLERVFPKTPEELPGLYAHHMYTDDVFPYEIIREYDELNETWEGQYLYNPRRNKWWARRVDGKVVLIITWCLDKDTLFFKRV